MGIGDFCKELRMKAPVYWTCFIKSPAWHRILNRCLGVGTCTGHGASCMRRCGCGKGKGRNLAWLKGGGGRPLRSALPDSPTLEKHSAHLLSLASRVVFRAHLGSPWHANAKDSCNERKVLCNRLVWTSVLLCGIISKGGENLFLFIVAPAPLNGPGEIWMGKLLSYVVQEKRLDLPI